MLLAHGKRVIEALAKHRPPPPLTSFPEFVAPSALGRRDPTPLDLDLFSCPPEFTGWTQEEIEAYESLQGQFTDVEADNYAKYMS